MFAFNYGLLKPLDRRAIRFFLFRHLRFYDNSTKISLLYISVSPDSSSNLQFTETWKILLCYIRC